MTIYVLGAIAFGIFLIYILFAEDKKQTEPINKQQEENANQANENIEKDEHKQENKTAEKFSIIVYIIKVIGYVIALFVGFRIMVNDNFLSGLISGLLIAIVVFFSTLIYEALAEMIKLLQDIKDKL